MPSRFKRIGCSLLLCLASSMAWAEIVVVVSSQSPVTELSRSELTDIYLGRAKRFPSGHTATPLDLSENTPAYNNFYRNYLSQTPAQIKMHWSRLIFTGRGQPPRSLGDDATMADFVAEQATAIGYLDDTYLNERLRVVVID